MKSLSVVLLAMSLLPAPIEAQAPPDNPVSVQPPDPMWSRVEQLARGQEIEVRLTIGSPVHCRFAGATDAYLFCDLDNPPPGMQGYRFNRAQIVNVKVSQPPVNWHPALLATMAAAGIGIGFAASSQGASDKSAAAGGLVTALMVGAVGYPAVLAQEQDRGFAFTYPLPAFRFSGTRVHRVVHWRIVH